MTRRIGPLTANDDEAIGLFSEHLRRKGAGGRSCRVCWGADRNCDNCDGTGAVGGGQVRELAPKAPPPWRKP